MCSEAEPNKLMWYEFANLCGEADRIKCDRQCILWWRHQATPDDGILVLVGLGLVESGQVCQHFSTACPVLMHQKQRADLTNFYYFFSKHFRKYNSWVAIASNSNGSIGQSCPRKRQIPWNDWALFGFIRLTFFVTIFFRPTLSEFFSLLYFSLIAEWVLFHTLFRCSNRNSFHFSPVLRFRQMCDLRTRWFRARTLSSDFVT